MYPRSMFWTNLLKYQIVSIIMKFSIFTSEKNLCILNGQTFVMFLNLIKNEQIGHCKGALIFISGRGRLVHLFK